MTEGLASLPTSDTLISSMTGLAGIIIASGPVEVGQKHLLRTMAEWSP